MSRQFMILNCEQRSPEWFQARCGRLTGSAASDMLDVLKDNKTPGYKRKDLLARLVSEQLTGTPQEDGYVNAVMQRGIDLEADAFAAYEAHSGNLVERTGFLQHTALMAGTSLDGHVGDFDGVVELKCPKASTHLGYLRENSVPSNHMPQLVHHLWMTGAHWLDFVSYDPRFPEPLQLFVQRIQRDDIELVAYGRNVERFLGEVSALVDSLKGRMAQGVPA